MSGPRKTPTASYWRAFFSRRNAIAWAVLAIALLANLAVWQYLHSREDLAAERQFQLLTSEISGAIRKRMTDHEQILLGGAGLYDASRQVDRNEWRVYVERLNLAANYPGIQGVGFARILQPQAVAKFEADVRREGFPNFTLRPPGARELYSSILFLEPFSGRNLAAFGYDMLSEPTRHAAILAAARSGESRITGRVTLVQETHGKVQAGLLMYVPVYRSGQPLGTPEQRLAALRGVVYSPYRMDDLMAGIIGDQAPKLDFAIYDGDQPRSENLLFNSQEQQVDRQPLLSKQLQLPLYGQNWTLNFSSRPTFEAGFHNDGILVLLGAGVSLLLFVLASQLTLRREQAEALAQRMTVQIRQSSEDLRKSEERQSLVLKGSNDGWWDIDLQAHSFIASARAWEMLGYPPDESPQAIERWHQLVFPEDLSALQDSLRQAIESGAESFSSEARMLQLNGNQLPVLLRGFILRDAMDQPQRLSGTMQDLSEAKRIERMKSEFVSTVSHELRTPLTSISGALGLINGGAMGEVPPLMGQMLQIAQQNSQRLSLLINDLLDMDKLAAGQLTFDLLVQPIKPLIEQALVANQAYAEQHDVSFQLDQPGVMWVRADALRLQQVLSNYLSNASKFSPPGASVRIQTELRGSLVRVSVSDQGPGIPEEFQSRIFEKFAQADGSDRREQAGTGLGLAISKQLIERMSGHVGFHSASGQGATFWFELPLVEEHHLPSHIQRVATGPRILVVEDDPSIVHLLEVMLGHAGYRVDSAVSESQALHQLAEGEYAAITLDMRLSDGHGLSLIRDLRSNPATENLPILVISAYCGEGRKLLDSDDQRIAWLEKPIDEALLLETLDQFITTSSQATIEHTAGHEALE
jgi:PAS domain S-box-containing protein